MAFKTDDNWSPSMHRAALAAWRRNTPAHDGALMPEPARPVAGDRPAAERFAALKRWRQWSRRDEPDGTNFLRADSDNEAVSSASIDRSHEIRPSIAAIRRELKNVEMRQFCHAQLGGGGAVDCIPVGGDIDIEDGKIVRMGRFRFSNGQQAERCLLLSEFGKVRLGAVRMPAGALMDSVDRSGAALGPGRRPVAIVASNEFFAQVLGTPPARYIKGGKRRKARDIPVPPLPPTSMTLNEARAFVGLPAAEKMPDGLPCGSPFVADSFIAFATVGKRPLAEPQDNAETSLAERQEAEMIRQSLSDDDAKTLDAAMTASNYEEIGRSLGHCGQYARHAGKRALIAANDNLAVAVKKIAS
ncbi:hypothetical protein VQ045_15325 [Aurantimonas sp. E1-2-R+4]|uniref:hypothetical protein n=1 Tax=Aurantimonas sp. E1-2-R+4 TaxID=3113714 RepID=UPI002F95BB37